MPNRHTQVCFAVAFFCALLALCFHDVIFQGKTFKVSNIFSQSLPRGVYGQEGNIPQHIPVTFLDAAITEEPLMEFVRHWVRQGVLPLWNPHQACGYPIIGMLEAGLFYPLNFIHYIFPNTYSWDIVIFLRFFLAGFLTFCFMRTLGFSLVPALVSGVVFMLSGPMVLLQLCIANVAILLPLLLLTIERFIQYKRKVDLLAVSLTVALVIFAGHPEPIFFTFLIGGAYALYRTPSKAMTQQLITSSLLGLGAGAIVLFPFIRNFTSEFWSSHGSTTGTEIGAWVEQMITLIVPHFFSPDYLTIAPFSQPGWSSGYLGLLAVLLALMALRHREGVTYFFAIAAILMWGKTYDLFFIKWIGTLPFFDHLRYYIHLSHFLAFSVAILAGIGINEILRKSKESMAWLLASAGILGVAILACLVSVSGKDYFHAQALPQSLLALGMLGVFCAIVWGMGRVQGRFVQWGAWVLLALLCAEMFLYLPKDRSRRYDAFPQVPYIDLIKDFNEPSRSYGVFGAMAPNVASAYSMDDLGVYCGLVPKRFVEFVKTLLLPGSFSMAALRGTPLEEEDLLDMLNVNFIVAPADVIPPTPLMVYHKEVDVFLRPKAFKRCYIVHHAEFESNAHRRFLHIDRQRQKLRRAVIINPGLADPLAMQTGLELNPPKVDGSWVKIISSNPNRVKVQAYAASYDGFLVLSDGYHPDWHVYVDGKEEALFEANTLFRAVYLKAGQHDVVFVFKPVSFYWGILVTFLSLVMMYFLYWHRPNSLTRRVPQ